jgi:ATP-dependent exoDNAse (exonuclease V) alpha subunit
MHVLQVLTQKFRRAGKVVLHCAATGAAAMRMSRWARTAHSLLRIPVRGGQRPYSQRNVEYWLLQQADLIIVDEYSMLLIQHAQFCLARCVSARTVEPSAKCSKTWQ